MDGLAHLDRGAEALISGPSPTPSPKLGRLVYVNNATWFFASHRLPVALAAREAGFEVHVAGPEDDGVDEVRAAGFTFHPIVVSRSEKSLYDAARTVGQLVSLYRQIRPVLAHHIAAKAVIYGGIAARVTRVPAVVAAVVGLGSQHAAAESRAGFIGAAQRSTWHWLYRRALRHPRQAVVFMNSDDRNLFRRAGLFAPGCDLVFPGSGVDPAQFSPGPRNSETPAVVLPARMLRDKGVEEFVAAVRILRAAGVPGRFVLVGAYDRDNPTAIPRERLDAWAAEGVVEWWGHRSDMAAVLASADVACLPSYREGLPKALVEAAAAGLPLVATDAPGCREIARPGENGILVPPADPAALADALSAVLTDRGLRQRMGARSREIFLAEYTLDRVVQKTLGLYERLLAEVPS